VGRRTPNPPDRVRILAPLLGLRLNAIDFLGGCEAFAKRVRWFPVIELGWTCTFRRAVPLHFVLNLDFVFGVCWIARDSAKVEGQVRFLAKTLAGTREVKNLRLFACRSERFADRGLRGTVSDHSIHHSKFKGAGARRSGDRLQPCLSGFESHRRLFVVRSIITCDGYSNQLCCSGGVSSRFRQSTLLFGRSVPCTVSSGRLYHD
jgi:hypothetical protein